MAASRRLYIHCHATGPAPVPVPAPAPACACACASSRSPYVCSLPSKYLTLPAHVPLSGCAAEPICACMSHLDLYAMVDGCNGGTADGAQRCIVCSLADGRRNLSSGPFITMAIWYGSQARVDDTHRPARAMQACPRPRATQCPLVAHEGRVDAMSLEREGGDPEGESVWCVCV